MSDQAMVEMPKYLCNKTVWALKIKHINDVVGNNPVASLVFEEDGYAPIDVSAEYMEKHNPVAGGYYVVYVGGYKSFSPAEPFETGYTKINQ